MVFNDDMTNTETTTSHTHEFLVSGCRNQWVADHDSAHCWAAFLAHNGAPAGLTVDGFYAWKYPND